MTPLPRGNYHRELVGDSSCLFYVLNRELNNAKCYLCPCVKFCKDVLYNSKYYFAHRCFKTLSCCFIYKSSVFLLTTALYFITWIYYISGMHFCSICLSFILSSQHLNPLCVYGKFPLYMSLLGEQRQPSPLGTAASLATRANRLMVNQHSYCSRISWEITNFLKTNFDKTLYWKNEPPIFRPIYNCVCCLQVKLPF